MTAWMWWTLSSVLYVVGGIITTNIVCWSDSNTSKIEGEDTAGVFAVMLMWPLIAPAVVGWGVFWLAFPPYRRGLAEKRRKDREEAAAKVERKRRKELAAAEEAIGLPDSMRMVRDD